MSSRLSNGASENALTGSVDTREGGGYSVSDLQKTIEDMAYEAASQGYSFADVRARLDRDVANGTFKVTYLVDERARFAFVGDVLFRGSVGRTDFAYGNGAQLIEGIRQKLLPLGDDIVIVPGHGGLSTLGAERTGNPFLQDAH